jgi:lactoylglutathione lyase
MKIEHIAISVKDLERIRQFYEKYFAAISNEKYENHSTGFQSYFLNFKTGARIEIMTKPGISEKGNPDVDTYSYAHIAIAVGSEDKVNKITQRLMADGYAVIDGPRRTGDGYYESVVLDPEGNKIEITI